jgi:hypothetical protein
MKLFIPVLKRLNERLDIPQPAKSRILLEIGSDLQELYAYHRAHGLSDDQAYRAARETLDLSEAALKELERLHLSGIRLWMDRLSRQMLSRWERILLILIMAIIVLSGGFMTCTYPFLKDASIFTGPVYILLVAAVGVALAKVYQLYIRQDHNLKRLDSKMSLLLMLSGAILFFGILGYYLEFLLSRSSSFVYGPLYFILTLRSDMPDEAMPMLTGWILRSTSMMVISMFSSISVAVTWFLLYLKITYIEQAEMSVLLNNKSVNL